ncbi:lactonase family protein [Streptomyces pathocidini]|uniref:lactonase family protein n=1 Tax=Streptomyces pathocidini TaxID=1650571 RepID=UPI0033D75A18
MTDSRGPQAGPMRRGREVSRRRFALGAAAAATGAVLGAVAGCEDKERGRSGGGSRTPHPGAGPAPGVRPLYIGTYGSESGPTGIVPAAYDERSGRITSGGPTVTGLTNPSFLALSPSGRTLYAADEREQGSVAAVALPSGERSRPFSERSRLFSVRATGGSRPCHLSVHPSGRFLLTAHYGSGDLAVHRLGADGAAGERTDLVAHDAPGPGPGQGGPHAHQVVTSPDGGHVLAVDLGTDTVYSYRLAPRSGTLTPVSYAEVESGAGPRHLTFHPSGAFAYLANELDNTVVVCRYDHATGRLTPGTPQPTGAEDEANRPAQLLVTPDGAFAYLANRGHNSLTRYAVEGAGARLRLLGTVPVRGDDPRHIALSPTGRLLFAANRKSGTVTVFGVERGSGELVPVGSPFAVASAACVLPA